MPVFTGSGRSGQASITLVKSKSGKSCLWSCLWLLGPSAVLPLSLLGIGEVPSPPDSEVFFDLRLSCVFRWLDVCRHDASPPVFWPLANAPGRIRTCDLRIRNPLLCPAELRAQYLLYTSVMTSMLQCIFFDYNLDYNHPAAYNISVLVEC